ncbi:hypothetical protein L1887_11087 [Cichorium endivia]|nr:hypothetical protein L1887_11087 [Cichorium endivia]
MCYPARVSCISGYELDIRIRRLAALAADVNHREVVAIATQQVAVGGGEVARVKKQCLCSPTIHPGSFRCKHHHSDYVWVGRLLAPTPTHLKKKNQIIQASHESRIPHLLESNISPNFQSERTYPIGIDVTNPRCSTLYPSATLLAMRAQVGPEKADSDGEEHGDRRKGSH